MPHSNLWLGWLTVLVICVVIVILLLRSSSKPKNSLRPTSFKEGIDAFRQADFWGRIYIMLLSFWPEEKAQQKILYAAIIGIATSIFGANHPGKFRDFFLSAFAILYGFLKGRPPARIIQGAPIIQAMAIISLPNMIRNCRFHRGSHT